MKGNFNMIKTNVFEIKLAKNQAPCIVKEQNTGMIKFGKKNDYTDYLLFLYNNHPEHGGIVRGKAKYITGISIKGNTPQAEEFLKKANTKESWFQVKKKCDLDKVIYGGYYLKVHTNALGTPIMWEHIDWGKVRKFTNGTYVICDDYKNYQTSKKTFLKGFTSGMVGTSVYEYKSYTPSINDISSTYPQSEYTSCILDIDTDIRVGTFFNSIVRNNFSAGTIITIFNGETDPKKKKDIVDRIKQENEGEDEAGKTAVVFVNKDSKGTEITRINANDLDKQYAEVNKRNVQKIVAGHEVPAELFKIKLDNKALLSRPETAQLHELFINQYAIPNQEAFNETLSYFFTLKTNQTAIFEVEQIKLVGLELPLENTNVITALNQKDPNIVLNYIIDRFGLELPKATINSSNVSTPVEANDHLKNLTGKQFQNLTRIVNKYKKKLISKDAALMMLKSAFNLNDEQALMFIDVATDVDDETELEVKQSSDKQNMFFDLLAKYSHPVVDDEILEEYEVKNGYFKLETDVSDEIKNAVLEQLKGNPFATPEDLAKQLDIDIDLIKAALAWLIVKKLIEQNEGAAGFTPTEKAMDTEGINAIEIYTEYTYELRPDAPRTNNGKLIKPRDFCAKMLSLYGSKNNAISFEAIDRMKNEFGDNVWDFRGGFYTNGDTGEVTKWCRHFWKATVKARKKKK